MESIFTVRHIAQEKIKFYYTHPILEPILEFIKIGHQRWNFGDFRKIRNFQCEILENFYLNGPFPANFQSKSIDRRRQHKNSNF